MIIGFFLRELKLSSPQYLIKEEIYVKKKKNERSSKLDMEGSNTDLFSDRKSITISVRKQALAEIVIFSFCLI